MNNSIGLNQGNSLVRTRPRRSKRLRPSVLELSEQGNTERPSPIAEATFSNKDFSGYWRDYFERNLTILRPIPWCDQSTLSDDEREAIAKSVQTFQLGESGTGRHFTACARDWGEQNHDALYAETVELFLREEHRHADLLGRFLDQEGIGRLTKQWSDGCFRRLRKLSKLRTAIMVLVSAEIMAQVYYRALFRSTRSPTLRQICRQILQDENQHVRYQVAQLARIDRGRGFVQRFILPWLDWTIFSIARRVVYFDHRPVFVIAGIDRKTFDSWCRQCWAARNEIYGSPH